MKLTTRGNYAICSLLELVKDDTGKHKSLNSIALDLDLSENYLRQLFMELKHNGIVKSVRGVGGGYYLARDIDEISILEVIEAVEGKVNIVPCLGQESEVCPKEKVCSTRTVWDTLNSNIVEDLGNMTLKSLITEFYELKENGNG